jgi:hypothetical protein
MLRVRCDQGRTLLWAAARSIVGSAESVPVHRGWGLLHGGAAGCKNQECDQDSHWLLLNGMALSCGHRLTSSNVYQ